MMIDEGLVAVVRRIFAMALSGCGSTDIAREMNREKIPTPGAYFRMKHSESSRYRKASEKTAGQQRC